MEPKQCIQKNPQELHFDDIPQNDHRKRIIDFMSIGDHVVNRIEKEKLNEIEKGILSMAIQELLSFELIRLIQSKSEISRKIVAKCFKVALFKRLGVISKIFLFSRNTPENINIIISKAKEIISKYGLEHEIEKSIQYKMRNIY